MPLGNPLPSPAFQLLVSATLAGTYSPVSLINSWDASKDEHIADFDVFQLADPIEVVGKPTATMSFGGYLADSTDTGQGIIKTAEDAGSYLFIKVLWDGTNGFTAKARVNTKRLSNRAGTNLAEVSYTFTILVSSIAIVALGPAL